MNPLEALPNGLHIQIGAGSADLASLAKASGHLVENLSNRELSQVVASLVGVADPILKGVAYPQHEDVRAVETVDDDVALVGMDAWRAT